MAPLADAVGHIGRIVADLGLRGQHDGTIQRRAVVQEDHRLRGRRVQKKRSVLL
jgi:hypothetical protein